MTCSSPLLSRRQVARALNVSVPTVVRLEQRGCLKPIKIGPHTVRHAPDAVARLVNGAVTPGEAVA